MESLHKFRISTYSVVPKPFSQDTNRAAYWSRNVIKTYLKFLWFKLHNLHDLYCFIHGIFISTTKFLNYCDFGRQRISKTLRFSSGFVIIRIVLLKIYMICKLAPSIFTKFDSKITFQSNNITFFEKKKLTCLKCFGLSIDIIF